VQQATFEQIKIAAITSTF